MALIMMMTAPASGFEFIPEGTKPTASADVGFFSQYVWRGFALSDVTLVIQPSGTVEYAGFSMNLWGNLDTNKQPMWNETDWTLAYDRSFGPVGVGVGYIYYGLDGVADSQEMYLSLTGDILLSPSFTVYREMAQYPGWYMNFGLSHSFELTESGITLDLAGSLGYIDVDGDVGYFNDVLISVGATIPLGEYFSISPMMAYSSYLSGRAYDVLSAGSVDGSADHIFGGVTLSAAF
jgi:hypothetical protein